MAIDAFFPKITLPSGKTDIRKGGGLGIRYTDDKGVVKIMVVDAFQGGEATNGLISWLKDIEAEQVDFAVATHAHGDHIGGFYDIVNAGIPIKEFRCYHIDSIRGGNAASREDSDNLLKLIRWLQVRGTHALFVDHGDVLEFGDISWHIYRNQPARAAADDTNAWEYVNNGSLVLYSPELCGIIFGDGPENPKDAIAYYQKKFGKIKILIWFLISHHGNCFSLSNAIAAKDAGAQFAYESCVEADGPGTAEWTEFGARRVVQQKITVWMQNQNIYIHAAAGEITFKQGSKTLTFNIPYQAESRESWVHNSVGWWYRYKDGTWPADCLADLRWSQGIDTFCFNKRGYMVTGWQKIDGKWYFFDEKSGAMKKGWIFWNGSWFYLDPESGVMHTGWIDYKQKRCYLEPSGRALRNCVRVIDGKTYQFDDGCYATEISGDVLFTKAVGKLNEVGTTRLQFVLDIANYVRKYAPQYGIKVYSPIIAQAIHESGWGESRLAAQYHNYFGMKCGTKWTGRSVNMKTQEEYSAGSLSTISANFRAYDNMEEGVKGYFEFIQLPRYANLKGVTSPRQYLQNIKDDGYATGSKYVDNTMNLVNLCNLTQFDVPVDPLAAKLAEDPVDVLIRIMEAEVGTHEGPNNHTKYGDEMHAIQPSNMDKNAPWCDCWFDWCILKLCEYFGYGADMARKVLCGDFDDYTYASVALYKKAGRWFDSPQRGDQIFFGGKGHTGGVVSVYGGTENTIEGNKGDEVRRCSYSVNSPSIIGYGRPKYYLLTGKITAADMPLLKKGSKGEAVKKLQQTLNGKGYKLTEDGDFGSKTEAAVKAFQKANGLEVDGEVGPMTWGVLLK